MPNTPTPFFSGVLARTKDKTLLTMLTPSGRSKAPSKPEDIEPHPYRLVAADNWLKAAGA